MIFNSSHPFIVKPQSNQADTICDKETDHITLTPPAFIVHTYAKYDKLILSNL